MDGNEVKGRDRVELALDGRQIASVVVGALVLRLPQASGICRHKRHF